MNDVTSEVPSATASKVHTDVKSSEFGRFNATLYDVVVSYVHATVTGSMTDGSYLTHGKLTQA